MKINSQIKQLNKELREVKGQLDEKTMEILDKNIEIAQLERKLFIALRFITLAGKKWTHS